MLISGIRYKIKNIRKREFELSNKGCIESHLKGNFDYPWKRNVVEYYVTAKRHDEGFDRVLVFSEPDFKSLFPKKSTSPFSADATSPDDLR